MTFERAYNAEGSAHRGFCELFGPEKIPENVGGFLGTFMIRKVMAAPDLLRAAGTVTGKLAAWLAEKGYVTGKAAGEATERGFTAYLTDRIKKGVQLWSANDSE